MKFTKTGIIHLDTSTPKYLINNFTETGTTADWTFGGTSPTLSNGIVILTGTGPSISSSTFNVGSKDIVVFEFNIAVPTPSTATSSYGLGIYLGIKYGDTTYECSFDNSTKTWLQSSSSTTNPYFLGAYNKTDTNRVVTYIFGSEVTIEEMNKYATKYSYSVQSVKALKLTTTSTYIRSGYNTNTTMVIHFSNPKIYKITECGLNETNELHMGKEFIQTNNLIEY